MIALAPALTLPLAFQPGAEWNYSVSTDVLGRVVEVASGMAVDEFFEQRSPAVATDGRLIMSLERAAGVFTHQLAQLRIVGARGQEVDQPIDVVGVERFAAVGVADGVGGFA